MPQDVTISEARALIKETEEKIVKILQEFQKKTKLTIEEINFCHASCEGDLYSEVVDFMLTVRI